MQASENGKGALRAVFKAIWLGFHSAMQFMNTAHAGTETEKTLSHFTVCIRFFWKMHAQSLNLAPFCLVK
jgi:hypothetical protein